MCEYINEELSSDRRIAFISHLMRFGNNKARSSSSVASEDDSSDSNPDTYDNSSEPFSSQTRSQSESKSNSQSATLPSSQSQSQETVSSHTMDVDQQEGDAAQVYRPTVRLHPPLQHADHKLINCPPFDEITPVWPAGVRCDCLIVHCSGTISSVS